MVQGQVPVLLLRRADEGARNAEGAHRQCAPVRQSGAGRLRPHQEQPQPRRRRQDRRHRDLVQALLEAGERPRTAHPPPDHSARRRIRRQRAQLSLTLQAGPRPAHLPHLQHEVRLLRVPAAARQQAPPLARLHMRRVRDQLPGREPSEDAPPLLPPRGRLHLRALRDIPSDALEEDTAREERPYGELVHLSPLPRDLQESLLQETAPGQRARGRGAEDQVPVLSQGVPAGEHNVAPHATGPLEREERRVRDMRRPLLRALRRQAAHAQAQRRQEVRLCRMREEVLEEEQPEHALGHTHGQEEVLVQYLQQGLRPPAQSEDALQNEASPGGGRTGPQCRYS